MSDFFSKGKKWLARRRQDPGRAAIPKAAFVLEVDHSVISPPSLTLFFLSNMGVVHVPIAEFNPDKGAGDEELTGQRLTAFT